MRDEDVTALLGLVEPKVLSQATHAVAENDLPALLGIVSDLVESGQDLNNFCRRFSGQLRNLMVLKAGITEPASLGIPGSLLPDLREQADLFSREDLLRLFEAFQKIEASMKYATQVRFHLEMGLIELAHINRLRPLEELIQEFTSVTEGNSPQNPSPPAAKSTSGKTRRSVSSTVPARKAAQMENPAATKAIAAAAPEARAEGESGTAPPVQDPRALLLLPKFSQRAFGPRLRQYMPFAA